MVSSNFDNQVSPRRVSVNPVLKLSPTYHRAIAYLLAVIFFQAVALKELHHLLEHDHEAVAHCEANGNETHLHGDEYHAEDCFVCDFHFAPATLEFPGLSFIPLSVPDSRESFHYKKPFSQRVNWHFQLRGPPALAA
jgi:hypothetical protein